MKNLLIIGAGVAGKMVAQELTSDKRLINKWRLVGFADDDLSKKQVNGYPVLSDIDHVFNIIQEYQIDQVIISIPSAEKKLINRIISRLAGTGVNIKIVPGIYEIIEGNVSLSHIRNIQPNDLLGREEVGLDAERISDFYKGKTILITGAGGSIGSEILRELVKLPIGKVVAFEHNENSIAELMATLKERHLFQYIIGDIREISKLEYEFQLYSPDIVFHTAAHKHVPLMENYPDEAIKNNILGTYYTAKAAIKAGVTHFLLISTDKAVNPISVMGATKRVAEIIVLSLDKIQPHTRFSVTRFGNVLASQGSVVPIIRHQIEQGKPITITHPRATRYFMSIAEAARLVLKSATLDSGAIYILDMGQPIKILNLAKNLIRMYGYDESEIPIEFIGLRKGEKLHEQLTSKEEKRQATSFRKLMRVVPVNNKSQKYLSESELKEMIREFTQIANSYNYDRMIELIRHYVPEYKGNQE